MQEADGNVSTSVSLEPACDGGCVSRNLPEGREPQGQVSPWTGWFSEAERSQVHWPAGRAPSKGSATHDSLRSHSKMKLTARASGTRDCVLSGSLVAGTVQSTLLAAGALGLGSADAASILGGLAAGRRGVDHFDGVVDNDWYDVGAEISSELDSWC